MAPHMLFASAHFASLFLDTTCYALARAVTLWFQSLLLSVAKDPQPLINALKGRRHLNAVVHFRCVTHGFFVCLVANFILCLVPDFIVCLVSSFRYNGLATLALAGPSGPRVGPSGPLRALRARTLSLIHI